MVKTLIHCQEICIAEEGHPGETHIVDLHYFMPTFKGFIAD